MGLSLKDLAAQGAPESAPTLEEIGRATHADSKRVLAVCKRGDGTLILARERTVGKLTTGDDGKAKRDRKAGTEKVLKPTAEVLDFAYALDLGLIE